MLLGFMRIVSESPLSADSSLEVMDEVVLVAGRAEEVRPTRPPARNASGESSGHAPAPAFQRLARPELALSAVRADFRRNPVREALVRPKVPSMAAASGALFGSMPAKGLPRAIEDYRGRRSTPPFRYSPTLFPGILRALAPAAPARRPPRMRAARGILDSAPAAGGLVPAGSKECRLQRGVGHLGRQCPDEPGTRQSLQG
jgi:hypothetical protein